MVDTQEGKSPSSCPANYEVERTGLLSKTSSKRTRGFAFKDVAKTLLKKFQKF